MPGEYISKGAFMIYGKKNIMRVVEMQFFMALDEIGRITVGPLLEKYTTKVKITQGREKKSDLAKKIRAKIGGDLDEIIRALPAGTSELAKR